MVTCFLCFVRVVQQGEKSSCSDIFVSLEACVSVKSSVHLPIMPLTVPKSTEPCVGVELSPRFCSTSEPWQKTLTNSPRWKTPTSCRCCRSSSVVAALTTGRTVGEKHKNRWRRRDYTPGALWRGRDRSKQKWEWSNQRVQTGKKNRVKGKEGNVCRSSDRLSKRKTSRAETQDALEKVRDW